MNEISRLAEGLEQCIYCPAYTIDRDDAGNPVCEQCRIDRLTAKIDAEFERRRDA